MACLIISCATSQKIRNLTKQQLTFGLSMDQEKNLPSIKIDSGKDTISKDENPEDGMIIMNAVKAENGEMVATDVIQAAKVTARFKNVAERHGKVDIAFDIAVAPELIDSRWQMRIRPLLKTNGEIIHLDSIMITGATYRKAQLKGYQRYERFLQSIISDSSQFINREQLEIFLSRNLPEVFRFKNDSSSVTDEEFASHYGITEKQALLHYTNKFKKWRNARKISQKEKMFQKYIKAPLITEGLKLDTVLTGSNHTLIYRYTQTIHTHPGLKKAEIRLSGDIHEEDKLIYRMPQVPPLTFYISSLSSLIDHSEHYLNQIIYRKATVQTACYIDFRAGKHLVERSLGHNDTELRRIENNLKEIVGNQIFDLDSIVIIASCSPEGSFHSNQELSCRRAASISSYLDKKLAEIQDSIAWSQGNIYNLDGQGIPKEKGPEVSFSYRYHAENWQMLDQLVQQDTILTERQKDDYFKTGKILSPDTRELQLSHLPFYRHLRQSLYPKTRTVIFNFYLHRKNMVKDTIHTTIPDTTYRRGVQALQDRDYQTAISLLKPYSDFNAALAYCALDYNNSALEILEKLEPENKVKYLLAILYSRTGQEKKAIRLYREVCQSDRSYVHRGNLDPEISFLIKKHNLNLNY